MRIALTDNPDLVAIVRQARAAGYDVGVARAGRLPTLSASASAITSTRSPAAPTASTAPEPRPPSACRVIPIFQGGATAARIRQAQALEGQLLSRSSGPNARSSSDRAAFANYQAAQKAITSQTVAVQANELALEGARAEQSVGTRTVLDVLNAEQELLQSQVTLVTAKRDAYVAGFQLLNAMGQAEAQDLGLDGGPLYDPLANYRRVAGSWSDWATDQRHPISATRTVDPGELPATPVVTPTTVPAISSTPPPAPATGSMPVPGTTSVT